jgi:hypothetical protein
MMRLTRYTLTVAVFILLLCVSACNSPGGTSKHVSAPTSVFAEREAALLKEAEYRPDNGPVIFAHQVDDALDVDASLDDWPASGFDVAQAVYQPENISGPADLSGVGFAAWDDDALYVALRVTDDALVQTQTGFDMYQGDGIELQFDHDLAGDFDDDQLSEDDHQIGLSPGDLAGAAPEAYIWLPWSEEQPGTMIDVAARATDDGYVLEAAVPWEVLGGRPALETPLGLCINVNDNDTPGTAEQQAMVSSCPNREWGDPTSFGTLILVDWK